MPRQADTLDADHLILPEGIALHRSHHVFVADADNHRVQVFAPVR